MPVERERVEEQTKGKAKSKTRKLHKDFDLEDFLKFYSLPVDNVANNELGKCYRLTTCPIKGEPRGHGIGLCQRGAIELARRGMNFREILSYFFPASTLTQQY